MPVRTIPKNYRNVTGVAASIKSVGPAQFESTLERDFLALLEFSPEVERFEVQPLTIEWRDADGKRRRYTPDTLVHFRPDLGLRPWLCEVKYRADLRAHWSELRPKLRQGLRRAKRNGWRFRLITEREVRTTYLTNARFLAPFRFHDITDAAAERLLTVLRTNQPTTPAGLMQALAADPAARAAWLPLLWQLMAHHRVQADLDVALTMESRIWITP